MINPEQDSSPRRFRLLLGTWQSLAPKIDPHVSCLDWHTRALYWLNGATQSVLHRIQGKSFSDALAKVVPADPIFVLGFWRSGTTLLHELLCCDARFGFPSTYACLNPAHFLLSEHWTQFRSQEQVHRPMDSLKYSWSSPQEDEFALLALGAPSAYEALMIPSLTRDINHLLDLEARSAKDRDLWCETFDYFLKLLTIQQGKTIVLKSPTHGYRISKLQKMFPGARYLLIERNPYEVFASNLKLWRTLTTRYSLEQCSEHQLQEFILAAYLLHDKIVSQGIRNSKPGFIARIRYEDLIENPVKQVSGIYDALSLGDFAPVRSRLEAYLATASNHRRNRFRLSQTQKGRVDASWGNIIRQKGYAWPDRYIDLVW